MDILYVIGNGSRWENNELRYSLRSIEKNGVNVGRIFIAGYCPTFIDRSKVTFVEVIDSEDCKHKNILKCIETVVENHDISDDFLYSSDDHFYVQKTDFDNYPFYRKAMDLPDSYECNSYHKALYSTRLVLEAVGCTAYNFAWHGNTHFNKTLFLDSQFAAMRKLSYKMPMGCEPSILMLNYWYAKQPFDVTDRGDRKFKADASKEDILEAVKTRECISCASDVSRSYIRTYLAQTFPDKSRYEL